METIIKDGMSLEVVDQDGKRYVKKPAGGQGGGGTGFVLEHIGDTPAPSAEPEAAPEAKPEDNPALFAAADSTSDQS
jgi:hypothetical protein